MHGKVKVYHCYGRLEPRHISQFLIGLENFNPNISNIYEVKVKATRRWTKMTKQKKMCENPSQMSETPNRNKNKGSPDYQLCNISAVFRQIS